MHFIPFEVARSEHEIQLHALCFVVFQHFADHGQLVLAHQLVGVVITPGLCFALTQAYGGAVFPLQPAAALALVEIGALHFQAGEDRQPHRVPPFDYFAHLVSAHFPGVFDHAHNAPVDKTFPDFLFFSHCAAHFAVVEVDVAISQSQDQEFHSSADDLVYRPVHFVLIERGVDAFGVEVMGVVVIDQARLFHDLSSVMELFLETFRVSKIGRRGFFPMPQ